MTPTISYTNSTLYVDGQAITNITPRNDGGYNTTGNSIPYYRSEHELHAMISALQGQVYTLVGKYNELEALVKAMAAQQLGLDETK